MTSFYEMVFWVALLSIITSPSAYAVDRECISACLQSVAAEQGSNANSYCMSKCSGGGASSSTSTQSGFSPSMLGRCPYGYSSDGTCKIPSGGSEDGDAEAFINQSGESNSSSKSKTSGSSTSGNASSGGGKTDGSSTSTGASTITSDEETQAKQRQRQNCALDLNALESSCAADVRSAAYSCDQGGSWQEVVGKVASQGTLVAGAATSGINEACSKFASYASAANATLVLYRTKCQNSVNTCMSSCLVDTPASCYNEADLVNTTSASLKYFYGVCREYSAQVKEAQQAIQNLATQRANAVACANATSAVDPQVCVTNPDLPGCSGAQASDCNSPSMASNKVCICSKSPNDPQCIGTTYSANSTGTLSTNPQARLQGKNSLATDGAISSGNVSGLPAIQQGRANSPAGANAVDGQQGGHANLSMSGGGNQNLERSRKKQGGREPIVVNEGFYGGTGGSKAAAITMGGSVGGHQKGRAPASENNDTPDLRAFLPQGGLRPRGIAGSVMGITGPDGITGPHSDIWQKVQNRYQSLSPTLNP